MSVTLTQADHLALRRGDADFLNNKGVKYYTEGDYAHAIEYYRLAAAMGNVHSIANLGYCYMYGRSIEPNQSLALAYFEYAAQKGDVDALYKLGNIYEKGANGVAPDPETAVYYYQQAIRQIISHDYEEESFPSLYLSVARAHMPGGLLNTDLKNAYRFLRIARDGYEAEIANGAHIYDGAYAETKRLLDDACFDSIREEMEEEGDDYEELYGDDDYDDDDYDDDDDED